MNRAWPSSNDEPAETSLRRAAHTYEYVWLYKCEAEQCWTRSPPEIWAELSHQRSLTAIMFMQPLFLTRLHSHKQRYLVSFWFIQPVPNMVGFFFLSGCYASLHAQRTHRIKIPGHPLYISVCLNWIVGKIQAVQSDYSLFRQGLTVPKVTQSIYRGHQIFCLYPQSGYNPSSSLFLPLTKRNDLLSFGFISESLLVQHGTKSKLYRSWRRANVWLDFQMHSILTNNLFIQLTSDNLWYKKQGHMITQEADDLCNEPDLMIWSWNVAENKHFDLRKHGCVILTKVEC